ncbi:MAG: cofactor-independent phosphoglycerate mutase [Kiritimatiellae bacterium]|nr:cofactor-independent phosphoglycerate mutase [Kiritimatiellia bacterium]
MADEPIAELGGKTPLEYANTPAMDSIARTGRSGSLLTLPKDFPTSSEVANMSVLGCDLPTEYCGRGPIEAAGRNIKLSPDDKAFRLNLVTVKQGILKDFAGGHISQNTAKSLINVLNENFGGDNIHFHSGVSYRSLLILSGPEFSHKVSFDKPDDCQGNNLSDHLPTALEPAAEHTAAFLRSLMTNTQSVLENTPTNKTMSAAGKTIANSVWPWSGGTPGALSSLKNKYNISSAVISAVDVIIGLGRCLGMDVITVKGATGYTDTNYEGKADAAIKAIKSHDLVYVHVEAIDEVSHEQNLKQKIQSIEDFDSRLVARVLDATADTCPNAVVLPDHPVPIATGKHTRTPVPVAARISGMPPDDILTFCEKTAPAGALGPMANGDLMNLLFG